VLLAQLYAYAPALAAVLAQTSGSGSGGGSASFPWSSLIGGVVTPVIVIALLLTGQLRVGKAVDDDRKARDDMWRERVEAESARANRAEERAEKSEERERRLRDAAEEKFLPIMSDTTHTLEKVMDFMLSGR
jgi:hypothetical protein